MVDLWNVVGLPGLVDSGDCAWSRSIDYCCYSNVSTTERVVVIATRRRPNQWRKMPSTSRWNSSRNFRDSSMPKEGYWKKCPRWEERDRRRANSKSTKTQTRSDAALHAQLSSNLDVSEGEERKETTTTKQWNYPLNARARVCQHNTYSIALFFSIFFSLWMAMTLSSYLFFSSVNLTYP